MRVRGGERDYYDVGSSWDHEPKPLYVREPSVTKLSRRYNRWQVSDDVPDDAAAQVVQRFDDSLIQVNNWCDHDVVLVGFAGRCFGGAVVGRRCLWAGHGFHEELAKLPAGVRHDLQGFDALTLEAAADRIEAAGADVYRALGCPIFLLRPVSFSQCHLERNPVLRTLGFQSVVDPYAAWQALDQFLGNELARQVDPPDAIDDTLRRDIHGFDGDSFKRGKGGPGRKRKKRT